MVRLIVKREPLHCSVDTASTYQDGLQIKKERQQGTMVSVIQSVTTRRTGQGVCLLLNSLLTIAKGSKNCPIIVTDL